MKLRDLDRVNHLVTDLADIRTLIAAAQAAEPSDFMTFIEAPGDSSLRMSREGASTTHSRGIAVSDGFLAELKRIAVAELEARRDAVIGELGALGVDPES